jgi:hypothetical protein
LYPGDFGHRHGVSEERHEPPPEPDRRAGEEDPLVDDQEGKGYGEDEGERDESLPADRP